MLRILFSIIVLFLFSTYLSAQESSEEIEGIVTYVTAQNVYVKFPSAKKIKPGNYIYIKKNDGKQQALIVENCSSMSCVGKLVGEVKLKIGDIVIAIVPKDIEQKKDKPQKDVLTNSAQEASNLINTKSKKSTRKQKIDGRLLFTSYTNLSNLATEDSYRLRYTLSFNAINLANTPLSLESYVSFSHKLNDWPVIQENIFNGLKIYSLGLKYGLGKYTSISLGRKINPQISSIGAVDGLQVESNYKRLFWGAVAGYRPDYTDYSFNPSLLEYGAYFGQNYQTTKGSMQTSVAVFEQTNSGKTDRRFIYFQHQNYLLKNLNLFVSSELELYKVIDGKPVANLYLTSLYTSLNFRPFKKVSIVASYDNRKNVIYYETFKNYLDQMLEDASRQGVQLRVNFRPLKLMNVGISSSYRFRQNDLRPTENINGFLNYNNLPLLKATATLSANLIQNSYLQGQIYGLKLSKDFFSGKFNSSINYRFVDYNFENSSNNLIQQIGEIDFSYYFNRKFSFSIDYEGTFENQNQYHRIYVSATKRF